MAMDELDEAITKTFQEDGRQSNREAARKLNISEGAVRQRLKRLQDKNLVRFDLIVDNESLGKMFSGFFRINIVPNQVEKLLQVAEKLDEVTYLVTSSGRYNVMGYIHADNQQQALDLMAKNFHSLKGINDISILPTMAQIKHDYLDTVIIAERDYSKQQ